MTPGARARARTIALAAACLAAGVRPDAFGAEVPLTELASLGLRLSDGDAGELLTFDRFGNAVTPVQAPGAAWTAVEVAGRSVARATHYAAVPMGTPLALVQDCGDWPGNSCAQTSAAAPATCGLAMEVPECQARQPSVSGSKG